jgi:hypothetical protein
MGCPPFQAIESDVFSLFPAGWIEPTHHPTHHLGAGWWLAAAMLLAIELRTAQVFEACWISSESFASLL